MRLLKGYIRVIDAISEGLGYIIVFLVIVTVALTFYNVVVRYLGEFIGAQLSSNTFLELQSQFFSLVFLLGFPYILKHGINVRVDFIYATWPLKRKALLDFWGHIFFLVPFCILGVWVTFNPVTTSWGKLRNDPLWPPTQWSGAIEWSSNPGGLPQAPIKTMVTVAFFVLLLQTIAELIKLWGIITERTDLAATVELESEAPLRIE
jgi:TRAP-type mannitol/chloroaromatic compound transport system permease small subunit